MRRPSAARKRRGSSTQATASTPIIASSSSTLYSITGMEAIWIIRSRDQRWLQYEKRKKNGLLSVLGFTLKG